MQIAGSYEIATTCTLNPIDIIEYEGQPVVTSRQIAENFNKEHKDVLEKIRNLVAENSAVKNMVIESSYENRGKQYPEYLLTRDGFSLLVMGFTGAKALEWKLKYIEAFNKMEEKIKSKALDFSKLSPELQMFNNLFKALATTELEQKKLNAAVKETKEEVQAIRDVVALNPNEWRKDTSSLINKIAFNMGGYEHIKPLREESYKLLDSRMGVNLEQRLTNKRRRMADEGVCKSKRDKLNKVDVIGDDKKLIEGYLAIIKDMAIKYGVRA